MSLLGLCTEQWVMGRMVSDLKIAVLESLHPAERVAFLWLHKWNLLPLILPIHIL